MNKAFLTVLMTGTMVAGAAYATSEMSTDSRPTASADATASTTPSASATNPAPAQMEDGNLVSLTGTVAEIRGDEFDLNYGGNQMVTVELDNFGFSGDETEYLTQGENVTVTGVVDDDLFEGREIEATNVSLNDSYVLYYYDTPNYNTMDNNSNSSAMEDGTYATMTGTVQNIDGMVAMVKGATMSMNVDFSDLGYNPFDDEGMQKIEKGDRVYVTGEIDSDFFSDKELMASSVIELRQQSRQ